MHNMYNLSHNYMFRHILDHLQVVPYSLASEYNYIDTIISQNTTQFYAQYVQFISQLHVSAHFRPSSGCSL